MDTPPDSSARPLKQFLTAFSLYLLWSILAWVSDLLGHSSLSPESAVVLISGIVATNLLFLLTASVRVRHQPPANTVALAQCVLGIVWATLYDFLSTGSGELVSGAYITTFFFATMNVHRRSLFSLAAFCVISFALVILMKTATAPDQVDFSRQLVQLAISAGIIGWLLIHDVFFLDTRRQILSPDVDSADRDIRDHHVDHDFFTKSFNQRYIMDSLSREKGWTDRSNNPFSICIFDIDNFSAITDQHGRMVSERILKEFSKRVRGALRAMDTVNPTGIERTFGRFSNEEYVAILPHTSLRGAEHCAERARQAIANLPFQKQQSLTISAGVAEYRRGETVGELLARAEQALHEAIEAGCNQVHGGRPAKGGTAQIIELHKLNS